MRLTVAAATLLAAGALALPAASIAQPYQAPPSSGGMAAPPASMLQGAGQPDEATPPVPPPGAQPGSMAPVPPVPGTPMAKPPHLNGKQRFEAANTTHDGRLTLEQAQAAGWRPIVRHFQEMDRDHKGYVTMQDIKEFQRARRAARAAAQQQQPSQQ